MLLICLSCVWVAGIFLGTQLSLPPTLVLIGLTPLPFLFFARQRRKIIILTSLCLIAFFAAAAYSYSSLHTVNENSLRFYNDGGITEIRGMVAEDPDIRDKSTHLRLETAEIKLEEGWQAIEGTALIFVPRYPSYKYGDVLLIKGKAETPPQLDDFDYENYLAHQGIYTTITYPEIEVLEQGKGFKPLEWVYSLRNRLSRTLSEALPEPQASLAQGIILGIRGNIPPSLKADFASTGTSHLLAISGLHLGIMAGIILSLGIWLFGRRRNVHIWLALGAIWLYAVITGMHPPVLRAAIMVSLFLAAGLLGRQRSAITALTFAAAIMVGFSPYILGDASFQLSFLAMAGLIFLFPPLQSLTRRGIKNEQCGIAASIAVFAADSFSVTLAAIIAIWPVVAYYFGIISFASPLATFLALPVLPAIIVTGVITGGLGLVALGAAQAFGWLAWLFTSYIVAIVSGLAGYFPTHAEVGSISTFWIWIYYVALAAVIWLINHHNKSRDPLHEASARKGADAGQPASLISRLPTKWIIPPLLVIAILVSCTAATMPDDKLHVSFLNVGQGDAILIQKGNQQILVDGGPSPQSLSLQLGKQMPFWDRTIDLMILTHPHEDHLSGQVEVLRRFRVEQVLYADIDYDSSLYDEWLKLVDEKNIKNVKAISGQQIKLDGAVIEVLNPQTTCLTGTASDIDNNGVVLRLEKDSISFLLTADIGQEAEFQLITDRAELSSYILKIAHHGSANSTTPEFLDVVSPQLAVISAGDGNRFGHPADETLERLMEKIKPERIYRTDRDGTIEFTTDGERLWVATER